MLTFHVHNAKSVCPWMSLAKRCVWGVVGLQTCLDELLSLHEALIIVHLPLGQPL